MTSRINEPNHANNSKNNENMLQKECHKHYKIYMTLFCTKFKYNFIAHFYFLI